MHWSSGQDKDRCHLSLAAKICENLRSYEFNMVLGDLTNRCAALPSSAASASMKQVSPVPTDPFTRDMCSLESQRSSLQQAIDQVTFQSDRHSD